jgi:hypothetical protein
VQKSRKYLDIALFLMYNRNMDNDKRIAELEAENRRLHSEIDRLTILNNCYLEQLRLARLRRFGASSEKTSSLYEQVALGVFNEAETAADPGVPEPTLEEVTYKRRKRVGKRDEFYEGLPTERVIFELPEDERICPVCGGPLHGKI